jgi:hypothetical protein
MNMLKRLLTAILLLAAPLAMAGNNATETNVGEGGGTINGAVTITNPASAAGSTAFTINQGAHTAITADKPAESIATASVTLSSGATIAIGSWLNLTAPTYVGVAGGGAETVTSAATLYINDAPTQGANATVSNKYALWVDSGTTRLDGTLTLGTPLTHANGGTGSTALTVYQASPADPSTTTNTTGLMMGLAGAITPIGTGTIMISVSGDVDNNTLGDGAKVQIRYGTSTAPINGAAITGTAAGGLVNLLNPSIATETVGRFPFALNAIVTGLTPSTAYWIDLSLGAVTGGTARIRNISISVVEF